ncbi:hypothetical protein EOD42_14120 [Rhodovarius crocodyli]|uniref:Uncharacterized protein n=1 Tax=Rhodovarius crocodyli TaxID=1979269 RepID=A0A437MF11_9PROT|nr:hypothetical protein [Rhodovarius crocodyli]RVT96244.1 hypothetical protein EOD42_14120 [Rhodovarius crocodyli]
MFDLNKLDTLTASEEGRWWHPINPKTGAQMKLPDGQTFGFLLVGAAADIFRDSVRRATEARLLIEQSNARVSTEQEDKLMAEHMARCTKAWPPMMVDGVEFPCTYDNAVKLWSDPRFAWLRPGARAFMQSDAHFFPE